MDYSSTPARNPTSVTPDLIMQPFVRDPPQPEAANAPNTPSGNNTLGLMRLHSSLSIVVDDVDEVESSISTPGREGPDSPRHRQLARNLSAASLTSHEDSMDQTCTEPSSPGLHAGTTLTKQKSYERLQQIMDEVENRKSEFARLLEEHAQVVARLKAIENTGRAAAILPQESAAM
ncbi:uncharacterized protein LOC132196394 [Neocloeon triangulifer]|uniref:uncharacterized protein LOC132196394 n=1 Tax=Neocloeon triangulifer TaxID=2078957 RepID=UPI00286F6E95|nr:uncharacterized protein LOC132196394 [Neocloeon triangulifer]